MKANKQSSQAAVLWHPNFRVVETLPDTKIIRTSFLINAGAVLLALGAATVLVIREQDLADLRAQTSAWEARILESTPKYTQAIKLQKQFTDAAERIKEIDAFVTTDLVASDVLRRLADTLPRLTTLDSVAMDAKSVRLRGTITGPDRKAIDMATAYVSQLKLDSLFSSRLESVDLKSVDRVPEASRTVFEIEMKLKTLK